MHICPCRIHDIGPSLSYACMHAWVHPPSVMPCLHGFGVTLAPCPTVLQFGTWLNYIILNVTIIGCFLAYTLFNSAKRDYKIIRSILKVLPKYTAAALFVSRGQPGMVNPHACAIDWLTFSRVGLIIHYSDSSSSFLNPFPIFLGIAGLMYVWNQSGLRVARRNLSFLVSVIYANYLIPTYTHYTKAVKYCSEI